MNIIMDCFMPAFTFLAQKANLSIYSDTITIYPKSARVDDIMDDIINTIDKQTLNSGKNSIGHIGYVLSKDSDHSQYHQDHFDIKQTHRHLKIDRIIDVPELASILALLADAGMVTQKEKLNCLKEFIRTTLFEPAKESNIQSTQMKSDAVICIAHALQHMFFFQRTPQQNNLITSTPSFS